MVMTSEHYNVAGLSVVYGIENEQVLKNYEPSDTEKKRQDIIKQLSVIYGIEKVKTRLMILYRYMCHKRVSYNILSDVKWMDKFFKK
jgi:flagellin-specific chaperone FliS